MKITKHAQSCFLLESRGTRILIDPGSFVFEEEGLGAEDFTNIDAIIITHEHFDHFNWKNVQKIIQESDPEILTTKSVKEIIEEKDANVRVKVIKEGEEYDLKDIKIKGVHSEHGELPVDKPKPEVIGVLIDDGRVKFYHPGDSILLDEKVNAEIIAVPFCGQVTMDIPQTKEFILKIKPRVIIPIHYDNPIFPADPKNLKEAIKDVEVKIMENGESVEF